MENNEKESFGLTPKHKEILASLEEHKKRIESLKEEIKHYDALNAHLIRLQGAIAGSSSKAENESINMRIESVREDIKKHRTPYEINSEIDQISQEMKSLNDQFESIVFELPDLLVSPVTKYTNGSIELKQNDAGTFYYYYLNNETAENNIIVEKDENGVPSKLTIYSHLHDKPAKGIKKIKIISHKELPSKEIKHEPYLIKTASYWKCPVCRCNIDTRTEECMICHSKQKHEEEPTKKENLEKKHKGSKSVTFGKFSSIFS
jgi:hypothetical protein